MTISEEQMNRWAKAPSETEEVKCQNAVNRITTAIRKEFGDSVSIMLQGSYKNRTNVKLDSDVDIVVLHTDYFFPDLGNLSDSDKSTYHSIYKGSDYTFAQFKNDIQRLLQDEFDYGEIERKNKCIRVKENSYRVNADVVPCFAHRRYRSLDGIEAEGVAFISDDSSRVYSFPEHHYENGVNKNKETEQMYKAIVRILKNVRNDLAEKNIITLDNMPSFYLECLVWNVLSEHFDSNRYHDATRNVIATIWNDMREIEKSNNYAEVSDLKWLFRGNSKITPKQAEDFMQYAWNYIGYEN